MLRLAEVARVASVCARPELFRERPEHSGRSHTIKPLRGYRNYIGIFPGIIKSDFSCQIDIETITEKIENEAFGIQSTQLTYLRIRIFKPSHIENIEKSALFRTDG